MDLRHFFENMVRREETASAFLATLLEFEPVFQRAFLTTATGEPDFGTAEVWRVQVEEGRVDVSDDRASLRGKVGNRRVDRLVAVDTGGHPFEGKVPKEWRVPENWPG